LVSFPGAFLQYPGPFQNIQVPLFWTQAERGQRVLSTPGSSTMNDDIG
jgi:hypothetical protein